MDFDAFSMCGHLDAQHVPIPASGTTTSSGFEVQNLDRDGDPPQQDILNFFSSPARSIRMGRGVLSSVDSAVAHDRTRRFQHELLMSPPRPPEAGRHPDGGALSPATASTWSNPGASVEEVRAGSTYFIPLVWSGEQPKASKVPAQTRSSRPGHDCHLHRVCARSFAGARASAALEEEQE